MAASLGDQPGSQTQHDFICQAKGLRKSRTTALLCAILGAAEELGVREALAVEWAYDESDFAEQTSQRVRRVTGKAWRFAGEMEEIADMLAAVGLPNGFHKAAADIYQRLAHFKGQTDPR